jgi:hypothetical protein
VWKLLGTDGWAIASGVFAFIGGIFTLLGVVLTLGIVTAFVGLPFGLLGVIFLGLGGFGLRARYREKQRIVNVLRHGEVVEGQITSTDENLAVTVNGRHPWEIRYRFQIAGRDYVGSVTTLNFPGPHLQAGQPAYVLHLPNTPENNALYPHP